MNEHLQKISFHKKIRGRAGKNLLTNTEEIRRKATQELDANHRAEMGQFLTPAPIARFMASMFRIRTPSIHLLDAGAGIGSLSAAFVDEVCNTNNVIKNIAITAYEINGNLAEYLAEVYKACGIKCERAGIEFSSEINQTNFLEAGASMLSEDLFKSPRRLKINYAILNPPYRKINSNSDERKLLNSIGLETSNLYTAFIAITVKLLDLGGQLVAITPRSFCNGPYFKPFRRLFLGTMQLKRVHVFNSRNRAFREDNVLQENIIFHAVKEERSQEKVVISSSDGPEGTSQTIRKINYAELIHPGDPEFFIRLPTDNNDTFITQRMESYKHSLQDLGISVSTGRVVDFRAREFLRAEPNQNTAPLIYPGHIKNGFVMWPKNGGRKPNAIIDSPITRDLLVPGQTYVLVKRFTAKEERRRVVAGIFDPNRIPASRVGFENHLNYYHNHGGGLPPNLAKGLAVYLNSTLVDLYFRQFSGHTQVNATDLRSLKYPSFGQLESMGLLVGKTFPNQDEVDRLMEASIEYA